MSQQLHPNVARALRGVGRLKGTIEQVGNNDEGGFFCEHPMQLEWTQDWERSRTAHVPWFSDIPPVYLSSPETLCRAARHSVLVYGACRGPEHHWHWSCMICCCNPFKWNLISPQQHLWTTQLCVIFLRVNEQNRMQHICKWTQCVLRNGS